MTDDSIASPVIKLFSLKYVWSSSLLTGEKRNTRQETKMEHLTSTFQ
jgi:hypothetical protein